jgi:four helix bundle protein
MLLFSSCRSSAVCQPLTPYHSLLLGPSLLQATNDVRVRKAAGLSKVRRLSAAICQRTKKLPRGYGFLVDQLNRATLLIAVNIAEVNGRLTNPDRRNFFGIARGSVQECVPLSELALRRKLLDETSHSVLKDRLEEIARMLSGLIKGLENRVT